jgi:uncharacterized DUF497 family protein
MKNTLIWDDNKRQSNLQKHGLDFANANEVLESRYRLDIDVFRNDELRTQSLSYVTGILAVLTLVHTQRENATRIISYRAASTQEQDDYYDWLENEYDDKK